MPVFKQQFLLWCTIFLMVFLVLPVFNIVNSGLPNGFSALFGTDKLESYLNYKLFEASISADYRKVVVGKEGWLFLGNHYSDVLQQVRGADTTTDTYLNDWATEMKSKQDFHKALGIETLFVVAPNKHSIYPEFLPEWITPATSTSTQALYDVSIKKGLNYFDLHETLINEKVADKLLYKKTDTHWNEYGSYLAYSKIMTVSSSLLKRTLTTPTLVNVERRDVSGGDLSKFLKIRSYLEEADFTIAYDAKEIPLCSKKITYEPFDAPGKCFDINNQETPVNRNGTVTRNANAPNSDTLLWFRDSFGNANSSLFQASFASLFQLHYNRTDSKNIAELIVQKPPSLVLYQIVERNVLAGHYLKPYPDVIDISSSFDRNQLSKAKKLYTTNSQERTPKSNAKLRISQSPSAKVLTVSEKSAKFSLPKILGNSKKNRILAINIESPYNTKLRLILTSNSARKKLKRTVISTPIKAGDNTLYFYLQAKVANDNIKIAPASIPGQYILKDLSIYQLK
ncbi:MAG: hypothetical protein V7708_17685 [Oceanicoccus sp.]